MLHVSRIQTATFYCTYMYVCIMLHVVVSIAQMVVDRAVEDSSLSSPQMERIWWRLLWLTSWQTEGEFPLLAENLSILKVHVHVHAHYFYM